MHPVLHLDVFTGYESTVYREKLAAMYEHNAYLQYTLAYRQKLPAHIFFMFIALLCYFSCISIALMFMTLRIFSYFCAEYHAYFLFLLNILCAFFTFWYICFSPLFPHFFFHLMVLPTTFPFLRFSFLYFEKAAFEICESIKSAGFNIHAVRE